MEYCDYSDDPMDQEPVIELGFRSKDEWGVRRYGDGEYDTIFAKIHEKSGQEIGPDGRLIRRVTADQVKNNGSSSSEYMLSKATEAVPIIKAGVGVSQEVDMLLTQYNQLDQNEKKYTRAWVAQQLNISTGDLNKALQPNAPAKGYGNAASRAKATLKIQVQRLQKAAARK
jgi:hypothetical protein